MCGIWCLFSKDKKIVIPNSFYHLQLRGPDKTTTTSLYLKEHNAQLTLGFHRLSIIGTNNGDQPFNYNDTYFLVCNGEIYNYRQLIKDFHLTCKTDSDCEVILQLYLLHGIKKTLQLLSGDFAFILYDRKENTLYFGRDIMGVRPLFFSKYLDEVCLASEIKGLPSFHQAFPVLPGRVYTYHNFNLSDESYWEFPAQVSKDVLSPDTIRQKLIDAVVNRLESERDIGFFLSGGLDSSLILAIALRHLPADKTYKVFTLGTDDSPDKKWAGKLVDWLNQKAKEEKFASVEWHPIHFDYQEAIKIVPEVIDCIESYDTTTVRASIPMYLMSRYVMMKTDVKVILSGEGSDELFGGYLYFHYSPSFQEHYHERKRLLTDLYLYDVLRVDRTTAAHGLEIRVPFLDKELMEYVMGHYIYDMEEDNHHKILKKKVKKRIYIEKKTEKKLYIEKKVSTDEKKVSTDEKKISTDEKKIEKKIEKKVLRDSFVGYLPEWILYRQKDALSDAVGYSWFDTIRNHARSEISKGTCKNKEYQHLPPKHPEEILFRDIFQRFYPSNEKIIPYFWLPKWIDTKGESSARVLQVHQK